MKTIQVKENTWNTIQRWRLKFGMKTMDDTLQLVIKTFRKFKLENEMEDIK
jgi:hypothetical protein